MTVMSRSFTDGLGLANPSAGEVAIVKTIVSVRRLGYDWGVNHDGSLVGRHHSQARAVIAATALAERLRLAGCQVEMRFDGGMQRSG